MEVGLGLKYINVTCNEGWVALQQHLVVHTTCKTSIAWGTSMLISLQS